MAIDPLLSGVRNETAKTSELYVTVDSAATPLYIAARTSGAFSTNQQVIDAANAGDVDASNWGQVFATPTVGENTKALSGLPGSTTYYYGFVQEAGAPGFPFEPSYPNTTPVTGRLLPSSQTGGIFTSGGEIDTYSLAGDILRDSHYDWRVTRNTSGGSLGTLSAGNSYTVYQLIKRKAGASMGRYFHIAIEQYGYGGVTGIIRASVDLDGTLTPVLNSAWPSDWAGTTPVVIDAGAYTAYGNSGWVWASLSFSIPGGHSFTNSDTVRFYSSDDPDEIVVLNSSGDINNVGFIYSDATPL